MITRYFDNCEEYGNINIVFSEYIIDPTIIIPHS